MITVENLTKSFHTSSESVAALRGVSFEIDAGSVFALYGPEGVGKSTLLRLIGLRERADTGAVRIGGVNPLTVQGRKLRELRGQLALLSESSRLHPERTVAGNIAAPLEQLGFEGPQRRKKVARLLDLVGLTAAATHRPDELNEGQRRRVALARALSVDPAVLLADEPVAGLSADEAGGVLAALDRTRAELGTTIVLATEDADVVRKICDGVAVLAEGTVLESGSVLELLSDQTSFTARSLLPAVDGPLSVTEFDSVADVLLIGFSTVDALLPAAVAEFGVEISTVSGGRTRIGETPIARLRVGVRGQFADAALGWVGERGGLVSAVKQTQPARVAAVSELVARGERRFAGVAA